MAGWKAVELVLIRPDIAYAPNTVNQFMHHARVPHSQAVERILKYLKSCQGNDLLFTKNEHSRVEALLNAAWAGSVVDRRSTKGYCTLVEANLVTWRSKKQIGSAESNAETEYIDIFLGVQKYFAYRFYCRR